MLHAKLAPYADHAYGLLRIVAGTMWAFHGMQKILGILAERPRPAFPSQAWVGGMIELICGILIAVGWKTSWAAFLASGTMAVAYIQFHWKFAFDQGFFPIVNKGELALLYAFVFLYLACKGPGRWSVDTRRSA